MPYIPLLVIAALMGLLLVWQLWVRALRLSSATWREILDASPVPLAVVDPQDQFRMLDANALWCDLLGRKRNEVIGLKGEDLKVWADAKTRQDVLAALVQCPSEVVVEAQVVRGDASLCWCRITARHTRVRRRPLVVLAMQDIQAQRNFEQSLLDSQAVALQIFDVVPETLLISDASTGEFIDVNSAWEAKMGYSKDDVVGKTSRDLNLWVDMAAVAAMAQRFSKNGQVDGELLDMRRADGVVLHFEVSGRQWYASNRRLSIWLARDITHRLRAEQALKELNTTLEERVALRTRELAQALDVVQRAQDELVRTQRLSSLGAMVAGVAHELNTPIGNAVLVSSTLADISDSFQQHMDQGVTRSGLDTYVRSVADASAILSSNLRRAAELINGFKELAVDQSSYQRRIFDLRKVLDEVVLTLSPTLRRTPFTLEMSVPAGVTLDSFPGPLGQVMSNLVNNAVLHAFRERTAGRIAVRAWVDAGDYVVLTVSDNGSGIPDDHLQRIFDPFFTTRMGQGGSGLGLHICFSLVNGLLGGRITATSSPEGGACFTLRLPLNAPHAKVQEHPESVVKSV